MISKYEFIIKKKVDSSIMNNEFICGIFVILDESCATVGLFRKKPTKYGSNIVSRSVITLLGSFVTLFQKESFIVRQLQVERFFVWGKLST